MDSIDVLVIGGGIAGASAGFAIAANRGVVVLEREDAPGYHTSGRSAAQYAQGFEPAVVRRLAIASRGFLSNPPSGFAQAPLLSPRGSLVVGRVGQEIALATEVAEAQADGVDERLVDAAEARSLVPALVADDLAGGVLEPGAMDLDVGALLGGFVRGLRAQGGRLVTDAEVIGLDRRDGLWLATTRAGTFAAPIVVNAAGAWADVLARMAGVAPLGLVPKRRTAFLFDPPAEFDTGRWPLTGDLDSTWYIKPEPDRVMGSLADETPSAPCDAQPEELDVAQAIANIEAATALRVRRLQRRWAGLRTFAPDLQPLNGFDPKAEGFYWLAGQGGYGMLTAPAMARAAAALIEGRDLPPEMRALGLSTDALSAGRLRESTSRAD
ncbi:MAG: FAD-binding oxidoreductase [Alphaproteobacteria bacterium]|nr:FAD-binding oxidoreductase [Alphaproteobacteria bacterium]